MKIGSGKFKCGAHSLAGNSGLKNSFKNNLNTKGLALC